MMMMMVRQRLATIEFELFFLGSVVVKLFSIFFPNLLLENYKSNGSLRSIHLKCFIGNVHIRCEWAFLGVLNI